MKAVLLWILIGLCNSCNAQSKNIDVYAYKQRVVSGIRTDEADRPGNHQLGSRNRFNFYAYWVQSSKKKIDLLEIWINGSAFNVTSDTIRTTPVEIILSDSPIQKEKQVLVPKTNRLVLRLTLAEKAPSKNTFDKKQLAETNELVIVYRYKRKVCVYCMKELTVLPTALMQ